MVWPLIIGAAVSLYEGQRKRKSDKSAQEQSGATAIQLQAARDAAALQAQQAQQRTALLIAGIGAATVAAVVILRR